MKKILFIALLAVVVAAIAGAYAFKHKARARTFQVTAFSVGQGDAGFIQFRDGQKMLIDCGPDAGILTKLGTRLPFYDRTIDYLLITHFDRDHYAGCVDVLRRFTVKQIITNGRGKPSDEYWQEWNEALISEPAVITTLDKPAVWNIASTTLQFVSPNPLLTMRVPADDSNNFSIAFRLHDEPTGTSIFFSGDMEQPLEEALIKLYCSGVSASEPCPALTADILWVGHHGSDTSSSDKWLSAVAPSQALISVGKNNRYGHPSLRVLRRLERAGATMQRTDEHGDITLIEM